MECTKYRQSQKAKSKNKINKGKNRGLYPHKPFQVHQYNLINKINEKKKKFNVPGGILDQLGRVLRNASFN